MRITIAILALSIVLIGIWTAQAERPNEVSDFMRLKLKHSQNALEGLATEDFKLIAKNAQDLSLLSEATLWQVLQTPEYARFSGEFRRTADALGDAADEKNLDGAALAYMEMTMKCIQCHKYVREIRMASSR